MAIESTGVQATGERWVLLDRRVLICPIATSKQGAAKVNVGD